MKKEKRNHERRGYREALEGLPAVERRGLDLGRVEIAVPAAAKLKGDHAPGRREAEEHGHAGVEQVAREGQVEGLADEDVLRVADERRRRADVRRARQREQVRQR